MGMIEWVLVMNYRRLDGCGGPQGSALISQSRLGAAPRPEHHEKEQDLDMNLTSNHVERFFLL